MTKILMCFPGSGKTFLARRHPELASEIPTGKFKFDFDTSKMSYEEYEAHKGDFFVSGNARGEREGWFEEYMDEIERVYREGEIPYLMCPCSRRRAAALADRNIPFTLVLPDPDDRDEYLDRFERRGNAPEFVEWFSGEKWDMRFSDMLEAPGVISHGEIEYLGRGEYLGDWVLAREGDVGNPDR